MKIEYHNDAGEIVESIHTCEACIVTKMLEHSEHHKADCGTYYLMDREARSILDIRMFVEKIDIVLEHKVGDGYFDTFINGIMIRVE